jgi:phosphatidylglycerophosphate synthase
MNDKLKKSKKKLDGVFATYCCTPVAQWMLPYFYRNKYNPNFVTLISGIVCIVGTCLLFIQNYYFDLLSAFLIYLAFVLDIVDGELSRALDKSSYFGSWLDRFLDRFTDGFLLVLIIYRVYPIYNGNIYWIILSVLFILSYILFWSQNALYTIIDSTLTNNDFPTTKVNNFLHYFREKGLIILYGRDIFVLLFILGVIFQNFKIIIILNVILAFISYFYLLKRHCFRLKNNGSVLK